MAANSLFDFINSMFAKNGEFEKTSMHERGKHFFMVQRFMSIRFPVQAMMFNHIKMNPGQVVTFWQENLSKSYSKTPSWMYVKIKKKEKEEKKALNIREDVIQYYCNKNKCSRREVDEALQLCHDSMVAELTSIQELMEAHAK